MVCNLVSIYFDCHLTKMSRQNFKYPENKKYPKFKVKSKVFFIIFNIKQK